MNVTINHPNSSFTGTITVLETVAVGFTNGVASVDIPPQAIAVFGSMPGFHYSYGAPGPAPAYDANLDVSVNAILGNSSSASVGTLRAAYAPWSAPLTGWQANTAYAAAQIVAYQGSLYQAIAGFTSGASFNAANWNLIGTLYALPSKVDWTGSPTSGNSSYANMTHDSSAGYIFHLMTGANMTGGAVMAFGVGDGGPTSGTGLLVSQKDVSSGDAVSLVNKPGTTGNLFHLASQATSGTGYGMLLETNNTSGKANTLFRLVANGTPGAGQNIVEVASVAQSGRGGFGASLLNIAADTGIIDMRAPLTRVQALLTVQGADTGSTGNVSKVNIDPTGANPVVQWAQYSGSAGLWWSNRAVPSSQRLNFQTASGAAAIGSETWKTALTIGPASGNAGLSFFGATVIGQKTRVGQLTDSSGGTASSTLAAITDAATANAVASLAAKVNAIESLLSAAASGYGLTA
jgi:hypothetical protein